MMPFIDGAFMEVVRLPTTPDVVRSWGVTDSACCSGGREGGRA